MRGWIAAAVGVFGLVAYLRRRRRPAPIEVEPADELRAKLAESRTVPEPGPEPEPAPEPQSEPEPEPEVVAEPDELGDRRQDVHDRGRAAIDELG